MSDVILSVRNIHKRYGENEVLCGIDIDVVEGEVVCILGPSGSGKSTLLRTVNHLEHPDAGGARPPLDDAGLPAWGLQLEITESSLMKDAETAVAMLRAFKNMGYALPLMTSVPAIRRWPISSGFQSMSSRLTSLSFAACVMTKKMPQ